MKIISFLLAALLSLSFLAGCDTETYPPAKEKPIVENAEEQNSEEPAQTIEITEKENIGLNAFDSDVINFINSTYSDKNYMFSPLSFRYAMALATAGANGQTQEELISAMGFESMDDYLNWTSSINDIVKNFDEELIEDIEIAKKYGDGETLPYRALSVANSIWHNTDKKGTIKDSYINYTKENFNAVSENVPQDKLVPSVNEWVNENTNGMIPSILNETAQESNTILVNTVYMKSAWLDTFNKSSTKSGTFTTTNGTETKKDFMFQQNSYKYYEDSDSKLVIVPMEGGINVAFVLGNNQNISHKLSEARREEVILQIPKFEVETSFDKKELISFLKYKNVDLALRLDGGADFSPMIDDAEIHIDDIIQKTKIKVDEDGTEAAAATAIIMVDNAMVIEPKKPKEFIANESFTYYIYTNGNNGPELLFFGQIVE